MFNQLADIQRDLLRPPGVHYTAERNVLRRQRNTHGAVRRTPGEEPQHQESLANKGILRVSFSVVFKSTVSLLVYCCRWCNAAAGVLLPLVYCCRWCAAAAGVLLPLVCCCRWCAAVAGVLLPLVYCCYYCYCWLNYFC